MLTSKPNRDLETLLLAIASGASLSDARQHYVPRETFHDRAMAGGYMQLDVDQALGLLQHHGYLEEYPRGFGQSQATAFSATHQGVKKHLKENTDDYDKKIYIVAEAIKRSGSITSNKHVERAITLGQEFVNHAFYELESLRAIKLGPPSSAGGLKVHATPTPGLDEYLREHHPNK
jgi:hypothetical protein